MELIIESQFKYRITQYNADLRDTFQGPFLFDEPCEAKSTIETLKDAFPEYEIWLEDKDGNRVAMSQ